MPDHRLKEVSALDHLVLEKLAAAAGGIRRNRDLIVIAEGDAEDDCSDVFEHFDPLAPFVHPFSVYSNELVPRDETQE